MQNQTALHSSKSKSGSLFKRIFKHGDRIWNILVFSMALLVLILIALVAFLLWSQSIQAQKQYGVSFFLPTGNASWDPVNDIYQAWPFIYGTLITALVAIIIAVPTGLGIAIFLSELAPSWLQLPLGLLVELLAAIPSVVYGLWGMYVFLPKVVAPFGNILQKLLGFLPLFSGQIPVSGASRLAAGLILAIMIIPTISAITRDVLKAIPQSQREASLALGATHWETISKVLIPYGLSGILGSVIIGLGRAIGETMAVTMVIGNSIEGSSSLLQPGYTMASLLANQFAEVNSPMHYEALLEVGLILFLITLILNILARLLVWWVGRRNPQEART
jgi:phosphate transport system permease protein